MDQVTEAQIADTDTGKIAETDGWFVLNAREARWIHDPDAGTWCDFESPQVHFSQYGINIHVFGPGQPNARYHAESNQEDFLVLHGECVAVVEGQERRMRQWDLLHCPPGTRHVLIGAGDGPCAVLMVGTRLPDDEILYPVEPVAAKYGASVKVQTSSPKEAYADLAREFTRVRAPAPF